MEVCALVKGMAKTRQDLATEADEVSSKWSEEEDGEAKMDGEADVEGPDIGRKNQ